MADSRPSGTNIRRRRMCLSCFHKFTTFEVVAEPGTITEAMAFWDGLHACQTANAPRS